MNEDNSHTFGIYLHIPFCSRRCDYCSFATWTDRHHLIDQYLAACKQQVNKWIEELPEITSVFIGGGTPNLVPAESLMNVLAELPLVEGAEFTVECNPDLVTFEQIECYRQGGVNRISLGVQSMVPEVLASLGRDHNPDNVYSAAEQIRSAGLLNIKPRRLAHEPRPSVISRAAALKRVCANRRTWYAISGRRQSTPRRRRPGREIPHSGRVACRSGLFKLRNI